MRAYIYFTLLLLISFSISNCTENNLSGIHHGMLINKSIQFEKDTFFLNGKSNLDQPAIRIEGENITIDFNHSIVIGSTEFSKPDQFKGLGIDICNGKNITIKNLKIQGYKTGLSAKKINGLKIINTDFSYNYRPQVQAISKQKDQPFNENEKDILYEGATVYLEECDSFLLEGINIQQVSQALTLNRCNDGVVYKSTYAYNTQSGIKLIAASRNKIIGNHLDWNVAGFNFGKPLNDLNAAGIHLYQNSTQNVIAFNSITHNEKAVVIHSNPPANTPANNLIVNNNFSFEVFKDSLSTIKANRFSQNISENQSVSFLDEIPLLQEITQEFNLQEYPLLNDQYTGYKHILMDTYGPYNFKYPFICTRSQSKDVYTLAIFGPFGNFKITGGKGLSSISKKRGALPVTLVLTADPNATQIELEAEYIGSEFTDAFGVYHKKGIPFQLFWQAEPLPVE